jgi:RimK-like ATP-grasp domain
MILLAGIPSESPVRMVGQALERLSIPFVVFNQRAFATADLSLEVGAGPPTGRITIDGRSYELEHVAGIYVRLMDDRLLPELAGEPPDSAARRRCRALHETLSRWADLAPGRVVNRTAPMASNGSKPYQAQLIGRLGFAVPESLMTDDPECAAAFVARHEAVIFKSMSGQRSIVRRLTAEDLERLPAIRACPVMFQAFVPGTDVRVHVVGDRAIATAIGSSATDYRYAHLDGDVSELRPFELSDELAGRCVALTAGLGLDFAGIDLRVTPAGEAVCFEVNPCPAFSYYEAHTGQPIADAVARHLAGR